MDKEALVKLTCGIIEIASICTLTGVGLYACWQWREAEQRYEKVKMGFDMMTTIAETGLEHQKKALKEIERLETELKKKEELLSKAEQKAEEV